MCTNSQLVSPLHWLNSHRKLYAVKVYALPNLSESSQLTKKRGLLSYKTGNSPCLIVCNNFGEVLLQLKLQHHRIMVRILKSGRHNLDTFRFDIWRQNVAVN